MNETSRFDVSAPKFIAFIAILILIGEAISYFYSLIDHVILHGVVDIIIAIVIFLSIQIIDLKKVKIPYRWWILLILGLVLLLMTLLLRYGFMLAIGSYVGATLVLIASLLEFLSEKKTFSGSKITILLGAGLAIYESIMILTPVSILTVNGIFGIIFALLLILTWWDKIDIKIPFSWWLVLSAAFVIFTWISPFYLGVAGTVIFVGFLLMLMQY
ncbi:MAG: hypothetical protein HWN79_02700 [Candidatus Lokiarchaeota archaeon]|nr:hypothetical protein [Candidatus Lokiarchaeota archaeon]